jgi:hypothetical protein
MTLYDNQPTQFFSATLEFHGLPKAFSTGFLATPKQMVDGLFSA